MKIIAVIVALLGFAALALGLYGGTDLGETPAIVRWSEPRTHHKSGDWYSDIHAELPNGKLVKFTAAHVPPPAVNQRIVLRIRRNVFGGLTYTWLVDKTVL